MLERISNYILAYGSEQMNDPVVQTTPHSNNSNLLNLPKKKGEKDVAHSYITDCRIASMRWGGVEDTRQTAGHQISPFIYIFNPCREKCVL